MFHFTYNSVVYRGISRGISFKPRPEQSTKVPSQAQPAGQALSMRHSPANLVLYSSWPELFEINIKTVKYQKNYFPNKILVMRMMQINESVMKSELFIEIKLLGN